MQLVLSQRQSQSQKMKMSQSMRLSQRQIQSLRILSLSSGELRDEIYGTAEKNPALEVSGDSFEDGVSSGLMARARFSDNIRYGSSGKEGEEASERFQKALESNADTRVPLSDHLLHQLRSMNLSRDEAELCERLVGNLNANGFHILAPISLLDKSKPSNDERLLAKCIHIVQRLDPVGTCCTNFEHSLLIQAIDRGASGIVLFILNGHFDFLDPPVPEKVARKANRFIVSRRESAFSGAADELYPEFTERIPRKLLTEDDARDAISFIKTLDPFPARAFGVSSTNTVYPDVFVEKIPKVDADGDGKMNFETPDGIVVGEFMEECALKVSFSRASIPNMRISPEFSALEKKLSSVQADSLDEKGKAELRFARDSVQAAAAFIDSVSFREWTVVRAAVEIVRRQHAFFEKGARFLVPLKQKDVAGALGVDDSTISRMANGKFLSCEFGIFPFGYFFTNAVNEETVQKQKMNRIVGGDFAPTSKVGVKAEIESILRERSPDDKPLSDQKIADMLLERGIKIARRTVAKYRAELNINSSYER